MLTKLQITEAIMDFDELLPPMIPAQETREGGDVRIFLLFLFGVEFQYLCTTPGAVELANMINDSTAARYLINKINAVWSLRHPDLVSDRAEVIKHIAMAVGSPPHTENSIMHRDILIRYASAGDVAAVLTDNPWMIALYFLKASVVRLETTHKAINKLADKKDVKA